MKAKNATKTAPVMEDMLIMPKPPTNAASNVSVEGKSQNFKCEDKVFTVLGNREHRCISVPNNFTNEIFLKLKLSSTNGMHVSLFR